MIRYVASLQAKELVREQKKQHRKTDLSCMMGKRSMEMRGDRLVTRTSWG
jgi:hypothetical protein